MKGPGRVLRLRKFEEDRLRPQQKRFEREEESRVINGEREVSGSVLPSPTSE